MQTFYQKEYLNRWFFFRLIAVITLVSGIFLPVYGQLVINEICSANFSNLSDEDGNFEDWIEIYNSGDFTINLKDYTLSDNPDLPNKWIFPDLIIEAHEFVLVFASGKDRNLVISNFQTAIFSTDTFSYLSPVIEPIPEWRCLDYDDSEWALGQGGFGFGEGIYNTLIPDTLMSVYLRKEFEVIDKDEIVNVLFHIDYDDGFIAFLNNHEIFRNNLRPDGKLPEYLQAAWKQHPAQMHTGGLPEMYTINNGELQRILLEGTNVLTLQLHNNWVDAEMSVNPFLSFGMNASVVNFPEPPEWFFHDPLFLHTNFKLASEGEQLLLFDPSGSLIDEVVFPELNVNTSFGRSTNGGEDFSFFCTPTPLNSNEDVDGYLAIVDDIPQYTLEAGIFEMETGDSVFVELTEPDSGFIIKYTMDGNDPSDTSDIYTQGFYISENVVVKARFFKDGFLPGIVSTNTYILNKSTNMPIIAISTAPELLWSDENGIYVMGPEASNTFPYFGANFWNNIEIPATIEYFDENKQFVFEQDAGMKINGGWSRAFDQKSLRLTARSCFGSSDFNYSFFPDKNIHDYKKLVLRNGGNDYQSAMMRDPLIHKMIQKTTNLSIQDYLPTVVYLNGEYWGIHNMREKIDEFYLQENFDLATKDVDLLEKNDIVLKGDNKDFLELYEYITNHNLSDENHYNTVCKQIEITNLIDYFAVELYIVNSDWPQNNVKYWRQGDGKWQYIFIDADNSMGFITSLQNYSKNSFTRILEDSINVHSIIFQCLLENDSFKRYFINRYADLMNTIFLPEKSLAFIDEIKDSLIVEMEAHKEKWGGSATSWANYHVDNKLKTFFEKRPEYTREHTVEVFGLDTLYNLSLITENGLGARIRINSIIPEQYPWSGYYFDSIPVFVEALPTPGMEFSHWQTNEFPILPDGQRQMWWHLTEDDTLIAHFTGFPDTSTLIITEVNFESNENMDAGDWIEIYNPNQEPLDVSKWKLRGDSDFNSFLFPENTSIEPNGFLVIVQDSVRFMSVYPGVTNFIGSFEFGLKSFASSVRLFDLYENQNSMLRYGSVNPWPENVAGSGRTIEMIDLAENSNDPLNWQNSCLGGSPGNWSEACLEEFKVVFTEFNYSSYPGFDTKDWVEIFNYDTNAVDLSFWKFKDSDGAHEFILPYGLELMPGEFLVICNDTNDFYRFNPSIANVIGNFDFGLSSEGDKLRLFDPYENLVSLVEYSTDTPWPQNINGTGRTAEVIDYTIDINMGSNWADGCLGGSPGMFALIPCQDTATIIVTEINYSSSDEHDTGDWFEIFNFGEDPVLLNGWRFRDSDTSHVYDFPDNIVLDPNEYLVVVQDSLDFISVHDTIPQFVGEFGFGFSSEADEIHLTDIFNQEVIFIGYETVAPWPENLLGPGRTLELIDYTEGQNDPTNWKVGCLLGSPAIPYAECDDYSISENENTNLSIQVHPNPFQNNFYVELYAREKLDVEINLKNLQGQEMGYEYIGRLLPGIKTIHFKGVDLEAGVYVLQVSTENSQTCHKLICY